MAAPLLRADGFVAPSIPSLAHKPPSGPDWVHEIKHDGYRLIVRRDGEAVRLFTRRGYDWTDRYPAIAAVAAKLRAKSFTLDGEAAVSGADGIAVCSASGSPNNPAYRPRRIGLRHCDARDGRERGSTRCQMQKLSSVGKFHDVPLNEF
jgi:hypothetical protein